MASPKRIALWIVGIIAALIVLVVATIAILTMVIDPNRYRAQLEAVVRKATGQPFDIRGNLEIAWFPWLGIRMGEARFGETSTAGVAPLIQWKSARVGAQFIPLIKGELIIDRVRLDQPQIYLRRLPDGSSNWEPMLDSIAQANEGKAAGDKHSRWSKPEIAGLEIRNGALVYVDDRSGARFNIDGWQLDIGDWSPGEPLSVNTELSVTYLADSDSGPPLRSHIKLETVARIAAGFDSFELNDTELTTQLQGGAFPENGLDLEFATPRFTGEISARKFSIADFSLKSSGAKIQGTVSGEQSAAGLQAGGPLFVEVDSVRALLDEFKIDAPRPRSKEALQRLALTCEWVLRQGLLTVKPIDLQLDDTTFTGEVARSSGEDGMLTFLLRGDRIDLARYIQLEDSDSPPFELPTETLKSLRAQGELSFTEATMNGTVLKDVKLRLEMQDGEVRSQTAE